MTKHHCHPITQIVAIILSVSCFVLQAHAKQSGKEPAAAHQTGTASWYGGSFIGGKTANGERYRAGDLTAAHRKLPFGTYVRVTNLKNNKSTIVRINNRGPFVKGRILDLSKRAATELSMLSAGTARIAMDVLSIEEVAAVKLAAL
jgi:rare lipoprotein A